MSARSQKIDARHAGHALVGEIQRDGSPRCLQLVDSVSSAACPEAAPHDSVRGAVLATKVLYNGLKHADIVVNRQKNGLPHTTSVYGQILATW